MVRFLRFVYRFVFVDPHTGKLSHTQFWSQIGYCLMCWAFVKMILSGVTVDLNLLVVFSIVVIGNHTLLKILLKPKPRNGGKGNASPM